jgi:hypothetical protein
MNSSISQENFTNNIFAVLEETFEKHHGVYLDKGTSLFESLDTITADEASRPVSAHCASLAAQVTHVIFYLEVLEKAIQHQEIGKVDWGDIWRRVEAVTDEEWAALKNNLQQTYQRLSTLLHSIEDWNDDDRVGGAIAVVIHTAYHLGEIRQALCTLKQAR